MSGVLVWAGSKFKHVRDTKSTAQYLRDVIYNKLQHAPQRASVRSWFSLARSIDLKTPPIKQGLRRVTATLRKHPVPAAQCFECGVEITAFAVLCD